jgi:thiamine pyrophosphokinase
VKKVLFVVSGGKMRDLSYFRSKIAELHPAGIICADSGASYLYAVGMIPEVIIGDMDSLDPDILSYFEEKGSKIIKHPETKDETDTQLALNYAVHASPDEIYIFGAFGSRIDHTMANLSILISCAKRGIKVKLIDEWCEAFVVTDEYVIEGDVGQTVSLLPFSDIVTGITLKGFEYSIDNGVMEIGNPYGVSNRLKEERGTITVHSGNLIVIRYFKAGLFP